MARTELREEDGDVGAKREELAVGHVDDAHLAEDDRQPQGHQQEHRTGSAPRSPA